MKATVADRILERLQGFTEALERGEKITEKFTCRKVVLDLKPLPYTPKAVKEVRLSLSCSQAVLAQLLGVSVRTVQAWECGKTTPSEMACRWLAEIKRDPDYWVEQIRNAVVQKKNGKPDSELNSVGQ